MKWNVHVRVGENGYYKGIEAPTPEEAERIAEDRFSDGDTSWEDGARGYDTLVFRAEPAAQKP